MFKYTLNELHVDITVRPAIPSALLVRRNVTDHDPEQKNRLRWVKARDASGECVAYIPGSSMRGPIHRFVTQVVSRWHPAWSLVSDPFDANAASTWLNRERQAQMPASDDIFAMAGPVERCFGMTGLRGRWTIADAPLRSDEAAHEVERPSVGIDRQTGASKEGFLFTAVAIDKGSFTTTISLVNYELWQLGLIAHVLAGLDDGQIRLGFATNRGFGKVRLTVEAMRFRWYHRNYQVTPDAEGMLAVPPLSALAEHAGLPESYAWRDAGQSLTLPLTKDSSAPFGSAWKWVPKPPPGKHGIDWSKPPWSEMGPLAADALAVWEPPADLTAIATNSLRTGEQHDDPDGTRDGAT